MDSMQRIAFLFCLICAVHANAIYFSTTLGYSRLQEDNQIYKPGSILHVSFETGFFNEPENDLDYKLAFGIDRFGYSHSDGDVSVSFWEFYFKPITISFTKHNIMFEVAPFTGVIITANNLDDYNDTLLFHRPEPYRADIYIYRLTVGYENRLGYQINKMFFIGLTTNYRFLAYGIHRRRYHKEERPFMGGWGLNFQYNLPW